MPSFAESERSSVRRVALFRNGRNQAVRIPRDLELPGGAALLRKEGDMLILEPVDRPPPLLEILASLQPLDEEFPDVDEGLGNLDEPEI